MAKTSKKHLEEIDKIAQKIRRQILKKNKGSTANQCYVASIKVYEMLQQAGYDPALIQGRVIVDDPNPKKVYAEYTEADLGAMAQTDYCNIMCRPLHYWVEVKGLVVDVTGDQFNDEIDTEEIPKIVIDQYEAQPRYIKDQEVQP